MHREGACASGSQVLFLVIQAIERLSWFWWFQTLSLRTSADAGYWIFAGYLLPIVYAPFVTRSGAGQMLVAANLGYALGFGVSGWAPAWGAAMITVASGLYKCSFGPVVAQFGNARSFPALYVAVNLAAGISALVSDRLVAAVGIQRADLIPAILCVLSALLCLRFRRVPREARASTLPGSLGALLLRSLVVLPFFSAYWAFMLGYRAELDPLLTRAALPKGSLLAALCVGCLAYSLLLTRRSAERFLRDGLRMAALASTVLFYYFATVAVLEASLGGVSIVAQHPRLHLAVMLGLAALAFSLAEALAGAVVLRLLMEAAPSRESGSAAYFGMFALAALIGSALSWAFSGQKLMAVLAMVSLLPGMLIRLIFGDDLGRGRPEPDYFGGSAHA